ncbi:MAG: type 4 pilus major pilin [Syntrophotalea acetylenica]|nr:type 4 pilus major pilin [Syntrophotalea acetylenica]
MEKTENKKCACPQLLGNQRGIGVISILVTVIIFLVILTGVFAMVGRTTEGAKLQQAQQDITAIQMSARQTYATSKSYAGLDNATAIKAGILPEAMVSGGSGVNPWNGSVTVAVDTTPTQFTIAYAGLPQEACMQLAAYGNGNWESVTAGSTDIPQDGTGVVAAAATGCSSATNNTVTFTSK